ncbi:MAG: SRPBCC family protein [Microscillaceae bacterium]|nr:SRPBCC family protein [Microscillaceae bacterium]
MQINLNAPVLQKNQIFIAADPASVWEVLTDINAWPNWNKKISKAQIKTQPQAGVSFSWTINGTAISSKLHTVSFQESFGWTGKTFGASAIHNWYIEAHQDGTLVKVEESMEGWLIFLFKNTMNKALAEDMALWLELLKKKCEFS